MYKPRRWALPPLPPGANRAERRWYELESRDARLRIANIWYELFEELRFVHYQDGAPTAVLSWATPPQVGRVTLGPPTRFTVRPHPGLRREHLTRIDKLLASAFEVDAVSIIDLPAGWFRVEMIEVASARSADDTDPSPTPTRPLPVDQPPAASRASRIRWHRNPLGRRGMRGPLGGPRTQR